MRVQPGNGGAASLPSANGLPAVDRSRAPPAERQRALAVMPAAPPPPTGLAAGGDRHIATVFRQMRAVLALTVPALARRLGTDIAVIMELEAGLVANLPPWPQTVRIVEDYSALAGVDPSPLLSRLLTLATPAARPGRPDQTNHRSASPRPADGPHSRSHSRSVEPPTVSRPAGWSQRRPEARVAATRPAANEYADDFAADGGDDGVAAARSDRSRQRKRRNRRLFVLALPVMLIASGLWAVQNTPHSVYSAVNALPSAIKAPLRPGLDYIVLQTAPQRDGLRWVDAGDPRARKTDRLPATQR